MLPAAVVFRTSERSIIDYYKAVADAAGDLPFFVYNLPQLTQVEFFPAMMEKLAREIPTLKGLKHSAPDFSQIRAFADMGLTCFSGNGAFPLPALNMGAVGTIDAPPSLAPWHYAELFTAWEAGDSKRAQSLQDGVRKFVDLARTWVHFDIFAWTPSGRPARPEGGECQTARALDALIKKRYGTA